MLMGRPDAVIHRKRTKPVIRSGCIASSTHLDAMWKMNGNSKSIGTVGDTDGNFECSNALVCTRL